MIWKKLLNICPYTHLWQVIKTAVRERKWPPAAKQGAVIMVLGICCPLFWIALISGASLEELYFHAAHSGIVAFIGLVIMVVSLLKK